MTRRTHGDISMQRRGWLALPSRGGKGGVQKAFYDTFLGISPSSLFFPEQRHKLGTCLVGMKKVGLKVKLDTGDAWVGDIIGSV